MVRRLVGNERPVIKTHLKYEVSLTMREATWVDEELKATDVMSKRVNSPQASYKRMLKDDIGSVLLAVNRLAHPSSHKLVDEDVTSESRRTNNTVYANPGEVQVDLTYVMQGYGRIAKSRNTRTTAQAMKKAYEVLIMGDNTPIEDSQKIREFDPGPAEVHNITISTD